MEKTYTCRDYRQEMILAGLRKRLNEEDLEKDIRAELEKEIRKLEALMGMD